MRLKQWMALRSLTQSALAEKLGISVVYLSTILNGKIKPGVDLATKIENLTEGEVTRDDIASEEDLHQPIVIENAKPGTIATYRLQKEINRLIDKYDEKTLKET